MNQKENEFLVEVNSMKQCIFCKLPIMGWCNSCRSFYRNLGADGNGESVSNTFVHKGGELTNQEYVKGHSFLSGGLTNLNNALREVAGGFHRELSSSFED